MRLSASRMNTWMVCPMQAKFKYVDMLPSQQHAAATFGTCIHAALETYNSGATANPDKAIEVFKEMWNNPDKYGIEPEIWPKNGKSFGGYMAAGIDVLRAYHDQMKWHQRTVIATEVGFLVPFGDYELTGFIDLIETVKGKSGKEVLKITDYKTNARAPYITGLRANIQFCADEETEILTKRGWVRYEHLEPGEDVLTYNQDIDVAEWQPAISVNVFPTDRQALISMEGVAHSSLTTKNHRWPVERAVSSRARFRREREVVSTEELRSHHRIPCAAPVAGLPEIPSYDDALVELVAWYWTEGQRLPGSQSGVVIGQSSRVNPDHVESIRLCLKNLFGGAVDGTLHSHRSRPAWREVHNATEGMVRFCLNGAASADVRRIVKGDDKLVDYGFISELTLDQLHLFIDTSIAADGTICNGCRVITQANPERLARLQMACSLAGIRSNVTPYALGGSGPYAGRPSWRLSLKEKARHFTPHEREGGFTITEIEHTGHVWCPETANKTWLARRRGTVYFTGNTVYDYASRQKEFWTGASPDFPGIPNGEWIYEMTKDLPRENVWYGVMQKRGYNAGERSEADYLRLYRVAREMEKALTHDVYVPNISGDSCGICSYTSECRLPFDPATLTEDDLDL